MRLQGTDIAPDLVRTAINARCEQLAELLDIVRVDQDRPMIADALSLHANEVATLALAALDNEVGGANVVPHLIASLDALIGELEAMTR